MTEYIKDGLKAVGISLIAIMIATVIMFLLISILNSKSDEPIRTSEPIVKTIINF